MKVGDIVSCKSRGKACIIEVNGLFATVVFLRPGMYMPEEFKLEDLEVIREG